MTWQTGTATDYHDLLDQLLEILTSDHCSAAAVNAGGSGYSVDDILTASGGTFTHAATFRVLTVSSGAVTAVRIETGGAYTSAPSNPVSTTTSGGGTGCTLDLTFTFTGWTVLRQSQEAVSATVGSGGSGYTNGATVTVVGGVGVTTAAQLQITTSGGVITAATVTQAGRYEAFPANPVSLSGGGGTGGTLNLTTQNISADPRVVIVSGDGAGSDTILCGVKTFNVLAQNGVNTVRNWALCGMAAYNASLPLDQQAGISPGISATGTPVTTGGAFLPLKAADAFPLEFWISATSRRFLGVVKIEDAVVTHYASFHAGWLNAFGTTTEFPYPLYIAGATARENTYFTDTEQGRITGLTECIGIQGKVGPAFFRRNDSVWQEVKNSSFTDTGGLSRAVSKVAVVYPCGQTTITTNTDDQTVSDGSGALTWDDFVPPTGVPGTSTVQLHATPDGGTGKRLRVPATISISNDPFFENPGEIDNVFWVSVQAGETNEDTLLDGTERYLIVQNGNKTAGYSFMAIHEA